MLLWINKPFNTLNTEAVRAARAPSKIPKPNCISAEKIRKIANLGCKVKYHHELIGRNSRLDTLQASFLNVKLKYLDEWNKCRRVNASIYMNNLLIFRL